MQNKTICQNCHYSFSFESIELNVNVELNQFYVTCPICNYNINIIPPIENIIKEELQNINIGDVVQIINAEHVWHKEFAIVCDKKPNYCRIEIYNKKIWVPKHWVKTNEPNNIN